jgi:hypothetical protein
LTINVERKLEHLVKHIMFFIVIVCNECFPRGWRAEWRENVVPKNIEIDMPDVKSCKAVSPRASCEKNISFWVPKPVRPRTQVGLGPQSRQSQTSIALN